MSDDATMSPGPNDTTDESTPDFLHPSLGPCDRDPRYLAVRWRADAAPADREALVQEAGAEPASAEPASAGDDRRPHSGVTRTSELWWVQGPDGGAVPGEAIRRLSASDLVVWVSPAFRSRREGAQPFAVDPTRMLVRESGVQAASDSVTAALGEDAAVRPDAARPARIPGYTAVRVSAPQVGVSTDADESDEPSLESLVPVLAVLSGTPGVAASDVKLENIPFASPTTSPSGTVDCSPPVAEFIPNDPMFADQWGLQRIGVPRAWQISTGSPDVVVAVIDEGVELGHPDLTLHPQSWNASTDTPDGSPTGNHGTACAGIVAARADNGIGVAGVAPGSQVMAIATATWADVDIAEGLYFAADNGARVVSMSFGVYESWGIWDFDLIRDALQYAHDQGLVLVAASGNEDQALSRFPGDDSRTLCVGGSNRSDERKRSGDSSSENWWGACYGPAVDVVAPCLEIPTTDRLAGDGYDIGEYAPRFNGTSAATPHVAGLAALILSVAPELSATDVRRIIESTTDKISPAMYAYATTAGKPSGTWHEEVGYGRVNAERALLAACAERSGAGERPDCSDCSGCGGCCGEETPVECRGPSPVPWLPYDRCMYFYEGRVVEVRDRLQVRVTYEHCLRLLGRQQGSLLYTTTLLPGEELRLYEFDRYRRIRSAEQRMSVQTSFRQSMSALSQSRRSSRSTAYADSVTSIRTATDTSISVGGGLVGFLGGPSGSSEFESEFESSFASGTSTTRVAEDFNQFSTAASQAVDSERSLVVSTFDEESGGSSTQRLLRNHNHCYAVTYFVRQVNEVYETATRVQGVEWRLGQGQWRDIDDLGDLPDDFHDAMKHARREAPRPGDVVRGARSVTLPTDGTLYEAELAHCSSCEPVLMAEEEVRLERARLAVRRDCLEAELLELELERRRALASAGEAVELHLPAWHYRGADPVPATVTEAPHGT